MKSDLIEKLESYLRLVKSLAQKIKDHNTLHVNKKEFRELAEEIGRSWIEDINPLIQNKYNIEVNLMENHITSIKDLLVLSKSSNRSASYLKVLDNLKGDFHNNFILPIKLSPEKSSLLIDNHDFSFQPFDEFEDDFLREGISCANKGYFRASIIMGWCSCMNRVHKKIMEIGLDKFNKTSKIMKTQVKGKFRRFNKEFNLISFAELQETSDMDILNVLAGMSIIDSQQLERLKLCYQYRTHSAHPGMAPIEEFHVTTFYNDIKDLIFNNSNFAPE